MLNLKDLNTVDTSWRKARIPKKTPGEFRELTIPNDALKEVQKDVLEYLYALIRAGKLKVSACAHGFIPARGCKTSVVKHSRTARCTLTADMKDFFTNCKPLFAEVKLLDAGVAQPYITGIHRCCTYEETLPQGSPTSPMLTNIAMFDCDNMIAAYAQEHGFVYTRYADDMCFTLENVTPETEKMLAEAKERHSKNPFVWFLMGVEKILYTSMGLKLNHMKDHIVFHNSAHKRNKVLGIVIRNDGKGYNAAKHYRRQTRAMVHNLYDKVMNKQGGVVEYDDMCKWAEAKGRVTYCNSCRDISDEDVKGFDPVIQEKFYLPLEAHFAAAREIRHST